MKDPHEASQLLCSKKDLSQVSWLPMLILWLQPSKQKGGLKKFRVGVDFPLLFLVNMYHN